jgi:predicted AAA+ superfamily ATPase
MTYIARTIENPLKKTLKRGKSVLLLGARQTGKTTLLKHIGLSDLSYTLLDPELRLQFEKSPNLLRQEIAAYKQLHALNHLPIVIIDEIQKVPALMDIIQLMIDETEGQFILTGSSVRKLRRHSQFNLLPGRVVNLHLDPLSLLEILPPFPEIETLLIYGSLPGIYQENNLLNKQTDLEAYVKNYLEEEIRGEALVRQLGSFARFLELAAIESGNQINISKLSQELGVGRHTIAEYFQILEDCLIAEKIEPITHITTRKKLTKAPKYLFFDLGIRRICAGEGTKLSSKTRGYLFEQFIGLELLRTIRALSPSTKLRYWRDHAGPEVDYVLENNKKYIPIEVKWTSTPTLQDAKHLIKFMDAYDCIKPAYIICQCKRPVLLHENIIALPWQELSSIIQNSVLPNQ